MLSSPSLALVTASLDGTVTRWSAGAERLLGWSEDEIVGRSIGLLQPPGSPDVAVQVARLLAVGEVAPYETLRRARDGRLVAVEAHVLAVMGADGPEGLMAVYRDLSPERSAEQVLSASEQELRAGFADSPLPQSRVDLRGRVLAVNAAMEGLVGAPASELVGRDALGIYVQGERESLERAWPAWPPGSISTCSRSRPSSVATASAGGSG